MDRQTPLPRRFEAYSKPGDGEVIITDSETGRSGSVRMGAYQAVCSLMMDLYGDDDDRQTRDELRTDVPAGTDIIDVDTGPAEPFDYAEHASSDMNTPPPATEPEPTPEPEPEPTPEPEPEPAEAPKEAPKPAAKKPRKQPEKSKQPAAKSAETGKRKLGRPRRTPEPASVPNEGEDFVQEDEFNLRRDPEAPSLAYTIEKKDGTAIGRLVYESEKKLRVSPVTGQEFEESTHTSLIAASVRIEMLLEG